MATGKKPFYLKASDEKAIELVEKYDRMKKQGTLAKSMKAKRKKNASKLARQVSMKSRRIRLDDDD